MKRDMDLVRKLLLYLEAHQECGPVDSREIIIDGCSDLVIGYNVKIMVLGGLIDAKNTTTFDSASYNYSVRSITSFGREFLDSIRDDDVWTHTKGSIRNIATASLLTIHSAAVSLVDEQAELGV